MKTIKTISNISYNTPEHFEKVVNSLVERGIIDWCYWIKHKADTDETKDHIHFVLKPSSRIDTAQLRNEFMQIDINNPKPLSCTTKWNFTNSLDDWLLYAVHDESYLASKSQKRNFRYEYSDICSTDEDALRSDWNSIDRTKFDRLRLLLEAVEQGTPFAVLVQQGVIPIAQRAQFQFQYNDLYALLQSQSSGRIQSHENVDEDGCIIEDASSGALSPSNNGDNAPEGFILDDTIEF